jgi:hypothetical protein
MKEKAIFASSAVINLTLFGYTLHMNNKLNEFNRNRILLSSKDNSDKQVIDNGSKPRLPIRF